jgi:hypothetical protein
MLIMLLSACGGGGGGDRRIGRHHSLWLHPIKRPSAPARRYSFLWYDVTSYGATGDGVSDDSAAIQAAINSVPGGGGDGIRIQDNGGGVRGVQINNSWTATNQGNGVAVYGGMACTSWATARPITRGQGVFLAGGSNFTLDASYMSGNSQASLGTNSGIAVSANVSGFDLRNNRSGQMSGFDNTQKYGILVMPGASNNYIITDNDLRGNTTKGLLDSGTGTNKVVSDNLQ